MKVFIVSSSLPNGGKERQIMELLKGFDVRKIEFLLVSFSNDNTVSGLDSYRSKLIVVDRKQGRLKSQFEYYRLIAKYKPEVIHSWDHYATMMSILPRCIIKFRLIDGSIRGALRFNRRQLFLFLSSPFSKYVISNSVAGIMSVGRKVNSKYRVIYNGIDFKRFDKGKTKDLRSDLGLSCDTIIIGMIANIRPAKDYQTFILVAKKILESRSQNIAFVSIGEGKLEGTHMSMLNDVNSSIREKIIFLGKASKVEELVRDMDICLLLSDTRFGMEGISNSIMEYMIASKVVIATDAGGNPEIIYDHISGFLVKPFDVEQISDKITFLLSNRNICKKMGEEGKKIIENRFSLNLMVNEYLKVYEN